MDKEIYVFMYIKYIHIITLYEYVSMYGWMDEWMNGWIDS